MNEKQLAIFQNDSGAIELTVDAPAETIWATQKQISDVFSVDRTVIGRHIRNVFESGELVEISNVQKMHIANSAKPVSYYSLDVIISVGYRVNSVQATAFRKWATATLRSYISEGFFINPKRIEHNKTQFQKALEDMKLLAAKTDVVGTTEVVDLASAFANTWFSLDAYDKADLPESGTIKQAVHVGSQDLYEALALLKTRLVEQGEATELFGQERDKGGLEALFGNVFQSFDGADVYPTIEEKAAHLLYFAVKNHVFIDGNKRSGAYAFVWFLKEVGILNIHEISPQALTAITLLVAESDPKDKDKMVGLVLLMLGVRVKHSG